MTAASVIVAFLVGLVAGGLVVWLVGRDRGGGIARSVEAVQRSLAALAQAVETVTTSTGAARSEQGEIKARLEATLEQVQRIGAIFTGAAQRGRAGEFVLENLLEATGMDRHRDFEVQVGVDGVRPDVVLKLPGRGRLVIDAKFPLDDFQRAVAAVDDERRRAALADHAKAVAGHVHALAKRDYPAKIQDAIDFTVCFVPSEDVLAAAYEERPRLFYEAIDSRVLIATPATLMALLWGVAYGWQQDARVKQTQQVGELAAELHRRLGTLIGHLTKLGNALTTAVTSYNGLLGSLENRVLPHARRFEDLGILPPDARLPETRTVDAQARPVTPDRYPASVHADDSGVALGPAHRAVVGDDAGGEPPSAAAR